MPKTILPLAFLLLACTACSKENPRVLPKQLVGVWTTDNVRYADRFLDLDRVYVIIGAGPKVNQDVQMIDRIVAAPFGKQTNYTIYSTDLKGVSYQISFVFNPINGGEITLKNQQGIVWKRRADPVAPPKRSDKVSH